MLFLTCNPLRYSEKGVGLKKAYFELALPCAEGHI